MDSCNSRLSEKESLRRKSQSFATVPSRKQPTPYPKPNRYYTKHFKLNIHILVYIFASDGTTKTQHLSNFNHAIPKTPTLILRMHNMSLHTISTNQITNLQHLPHEILISQNTIYNSRDPI